MQRGILILTFFSYFQLYGNEFGIVPYIMPGFDLALKAAQVYEQDPSVKGLLLLKHGLFTFGATAQVISMATIILTFLGKLHKTYRNYKESSGIPFKASSQATEHASTLL
jgi:rhamnose utilization protein RhaD (predicted bifunctional aldolase and dehydrogenase)